MTIIHYDSLSPAQDKAILSSILTRSSSSGHPSHLFRQWFFRPSSLLTVGASLYRILTGFLVPLCRGLALFLLQNYFLGYFGT